MTSGSSPDTVFISTLILDSVPRAPLNLVPENNVSFRRHTAQPTANTLEGLMPPCPGWECRCSLWLLTAVFWIAGDFWDILALSRSARLKLLPYNDFYEHTVEFPAYVTCDPTAHSVTDVFIMSDMKEIGETGKKCHSSQFLFRKADFSFKNAS